MLFPKNKVQRRFQLNFALILGTFTLPSCLLPLLDIGVGATEPSVDCE